jgi:hypothetical protein
VSILKERPAQQEHTALRELAEHEEAIERAKQRVRELEVQAHDAAQNVRDAAADLEEYYRQLGAGEIEADPERERQLKATVREIDADLTTKSVANPRADGDPYSLTTVNRRIDAMLQGAREALARAEQEYDEFIRANKRAIAHELRAEADALVEQYKDTWAKVVELHRQWDDHRVRWRPLIERSSLDYRFPESPLFGRSDKLEPPVPSLILEGKKFKRK